jgi:hypothetical protein
MLSAVIGLRNHQTLRQHYVRASGHGTVLP